MKQREKIGLSLIIITLGAATGKLLNTYAGATQSDTNCARALSQTNIAQGDTVNIEGALTQEGKPVPNEILHITSNNNEIGTAETDDEGRFAYTYKFEDAGTYDVKTNLNYYEKALESPIATVMVNSPSPILSDLMVPAIGGIIILAAFVGYIIIKKR